LPDEDSAKMTNIWPIGGGKGGSGKSFLAGNLGIWLAKEGNKTLLIDGDFGAANLHTMIGIPYQPKSLSDFLNKKVETLAETVIDTGVPNLFLISGAGNNLDAANMPYEQKMKIFRAISKLSYDFTLLDLGAGTSFNTIDFFLISDSGIFVTTPEPTSIENVYRLMRAVYARKIRQLLKTCHFRTLVEETEARSNGAMVNNPEYLLSVIKELEPEKGKIVEQGLRCFQFKLVLNQFRKQDNPKLGALICRIIEKHLGLPVQFIGNIAYDDLVHDAVCQRVPFLDKYPHTQTAVDLKKFCKHILVARGKGEGCDAAEEVLEKATRGREQRGIKSNEAISRTHTL
jgi:flagellar biosynthesis protein FlhG